MFFSAPCFFVFVDVDAVDVVLVVVAVDVVDVVVVVVVGFFRSFIGKLIRN